MRSDCNCALGKWLYGDGRAHATLGAYQVVLREHKAFHEIAASVINVINAGRREEANANILSGPFRIQSKTVVIALDNLRRALAGRPVQGKPIFARTSLAAKACFSSAGLAAATLVAMAPLAWIAAQDGATTWQIATAATIGAAIAAPPLFAYCAWVTKSMVRPVRDLTRAVLRAERNDFSAELSTLHRWDEIGEMTDAVQILTAAAQEKQRVEKEASELRQRAEAEREANAQHRAAAAAEKEQAARRLADEQAAALAERERVSAEQSLAIQRLGEAVSNLADKNLAYRVTDRLAESYEPLRADLNSALEQLESAFASVAQSAKAVDNGTREIAIASNDLSKRTEQQASSLEDLRPR